MPALRWKPLGRSTALTVRHWPKIRREIAPAPRLFRGEPPRRSPDLWRYRLPRHRGQLIGCCVPMAGVAAAETANQTPDPLKEDSRPTGNPATYSELAAYFDGRRYIAENVDPSILRGEGSIVSYTLEALREAGFRPADAWPATEANYRDYYKVERSGRLPVALDDAPRSRPIGEVRRLESWPAIKEFQAAGYSVWIGVPWPGGAMETRPDPQGGLPWTTWSGRSVGGHAVELLGYDEDEDYQVIGNSWMNAGWGSPDAGCAKVKLSTFARVFSASRMSSGESEAVVFAEVEGEFHVKTDRSYWDKLGQIA